MDFPILDDKFMAYLQDRVHIYDGMLLLLLSVCLMVGWCRFVNLADNNYILEAPISTSWKKRKNVLCQGDTFEKSSQNDKNRING